MLDLFGPLPIPVSPKEWASITSSGNPTIDSSNAAPVFYGFTLVSGFGYSTRKRNGRKGICHANQDAIINAERQPCFGV
jgi:hypothetical protein